MRNMPRTVWGCPFQNCFERLNPSNSASNFANPSLSVRIAVEKEIFKPSQTILELGAGNLRNALFIMNSIPLIKIFAYELEPTIQRFSHNYRLFKKAGGQIIKGEIGIRKYDIIVSTFVLETICPSTRRKAYLSKMYRALKGRGILIASFRGYPGVIGSRYYTCPMEEGLVSPLGTFVKPYDIPEIISLLTEVGFKSISFLQKYRCDRPRNIHLIAF
jgi:hypothetical protein